MTPEEARDVLLEYVNDEFSSKALDVLYEMAHNGQHAVAVANSATSKQIWRIKKAIESYENVNLESLSSFIGRELKDVNDLTKKEASSIISELK